MAVVSRVIVEEGEVALACLVQCHGLDVPGKTEELCFAVITFLKSALLRPSKSNPAMSLDDDFVKLLIEVLDPEFKDLEKRKDALKKLEDALWV